MPQPRRLAMINSDGKSTPPVTDPEGIETRLYDPRFRVMAKTPYDHIFTELGAIETAERAIEEGCDAIYIDTFGDYGIERIRSLTALPVVGAAEASIAHAARTLGDFSIVTVWPRSLGYLYSERLRTSQGGDRCRAVHHLSDESELDLVSTQNGVKARMSRGDASVVDRLVEMCNTAVTKDRVAGILLGCTCMHPVAQQIQDRVDFPVLDASTVGLDAAFHAVAEGADVRRGRTLTQRPGLASELINSYLAANESEVMWLDACEVCAIEPLA